MRCPFCYHTETKVVDKRTGSDENSIRRRRECLKCEARFTTYETAELTTLHILKKNGDREIFNRQKLMEGIVKACEKRPISSQDIEEMTNKIEAELRQKDSSEVTSTTVGEKIMKYLKRKDKVAYIRFASVYRDFADLEEFKDELVKLTNKKK